MSDDMVDYLHAAEDHIGVLQSQLDQLWKILQLPYDWSPDTLDEIACAMGRFGYSQIPEEPMRTAEAKDIERWGELEARHPRVAQRLLERHTPAGYCRGDCEPNIDDCNDGFCGCPCHGRKR